MIKGKKFLYWIVGCIVAVVGVGVTRFYLVSSLSLTQYRLPLLIVGTTIAFAGLWILTKGTGCQYDVESENKKANGASEDRTGAP